MHIFAVQSSFQADANQSWSQLEPLGPINKTGPNFQALIVNIKGNVKNLCIPGARVDIVLVVNKVLRVNGGGMEASTYGRLYMIRYKYVKKKL